MLKIDPIKILTRSEIRLVIEDLKRRRRRSINTAQNAIIFRLAACCGLRVSEIAGLKLANVKVRGQLPHVQVPASIAKLGKARQVPLWWDAATLADLEQWLTQRKVQGAKTGDPFVCAQSKGAHGKPLSVRNIQHRWRVAIRALGPERVSLLSIHKGRHSFVSHALAGGRTLPEVRDAAGHSNISMTSCYAHVVRDEDEAVGNIFAF